MMETTKSNGQHILVVDDDPSIGGLLTQRLQAEGYHPVICTHPKDAVTISERETFALAFVDINLPDMSGLDLTSKLKELNPLCEVVFITGYGSFDNAVQAIKSGAYDYLRKPLSIGEFKLCLKRFQERQALREQLDLAEQRYFQLVQNIPLLIFVLNSNFQLDFVNEACSGMFGYSREEAMNLPNWFLGRILSKDRDEAKRQFQSAFKSGSPVSMQCQLIHRDGHLIHVIVKSIPQSSYETGVAGQRMEGFVIDITDQVFLEKALVQREKLKTLGAISAEVAHEIRNPLVCIGGFAQRLKQKFPDSFECDIILSESQRLEELLSRIRNYLNPAEIHPHECAVNTIITDCLDLLSPETEQRHVKCLVDLAPGLPVAYVDPEILAQIFINLIRNATKATEKGESLSIKTYESDQDLHIEFKNRAPGLKNKNPEVFFMPFAEGGQSIGLPLCYRLLKDLGGFLSFTQEKDYVVLTASLPKTAPKEAYKK